MQKSKDLYLLWYSFYLVLPKTHRYTLGQKVDRILIELIEAISIAVFLPKEEKPSYLKVAIRKNDVLKIFFLILWETKSLNNNKYLALSEKTGEIGKMLGGWLGQINKQNSSHK